MYPAEEGDAFLVSFGEFHEVNIMIDMGLSKTYTNCIRADLLALKNNGKKIDLLVITHVDEDHIQGAIRFFEENGPEQKIIEVSEVWHNSYRHLQFEKEKSRMTNDEQLSLEQLKLQNQSRKSDGISDISVVQGTTLARLLYANGVNWNTSFGDNAVCIDNSFECFIPDINIKLLSPNKEKLSRLSKHWLNKLNSMSYDFSINDDEIFDDAFELYMQYIRDDVATTSNISSSKEHFDIVGLAAVEGEDKSKTNGSSISFILEYAGKKLLFLGDSHEDIIFDELTLLQATGYLLHFDVVKISHHGSNNNISKRLLDLIQSQRYLISTNGLKHSHPNLEAISKIAMAGHRKLILTNYSHEKLDCFAVPALKEKYKYELQQCNNITIA